jgi:hypothetical protein
MFFFLNKFIIIIICLNLEEYYIHKLFDSELIKIKILKKFLNSSCKIFYFYNLKKDNKKIYF